MYLYAAPSFVFSSKDKSSSENPFWRDTIVLTHSHSAEADHIAKLQSAMRSTLWEFHENVATLKVCIISVPVHVISVRKLGVSLAVRDPSERRMVVETWVEDLVDYFLRLGSANFPHGQDGAKGAASDALLMMPL